MTMGSIQIQVRSATVCAISLGLCIMDAKYEASQSYVIFIYLSYIWQCCQYLSEVFECQDERENNGLECMWLEAVMT